MRFDENIFYDSHSTPIIKTFHSSVPPMLRGVREHHHTECEMSIVLRGAGDYLVGERTYSFKAGDMFLFGSNEAHCITLVTEDLELLNVQFEPRLLWESPEYYELLRLFTSRSDSFSNIFSHRDEKLQNFVRSIEEELRERRIGYAVQLKSVLFSALVHILRSYDYTKEEDITLGGATARKMTDAIKYIEENLENNLTLEGISSVACMAPTYFSAVFKKFNGISPWDYIMIKRVERAIEMLRDTDMTKLEIAQRCGFTSASNFYKIFKKVTGKVPTDYARN